MDEVSFNQAMGLPSQPEDSPQADPSLLDYANSQLGKGLTPDDAMSSVFNKYGEGQPISFIYNPATKQFTDNAGKPAGDSGIVPLSDDLLLPTTASKKKGSVTNIQNNELMGPTDFEELQGLEESMGRMGKDVKNAWLGVGQYVSNFKQEHETFDAGPVTAKEKAAAKLLGMPDPGQEFPLDFMKYGPAGLFRNLSPMASNHGQVYKLGPEQQQELSDAWMETHGGTPKGERERVESTLQGKAAEFDPVAPLLHDNPFLSALASPEMANTKKYYLLQDTVHAMDVVSNPSKYPKEEVQQEQKKIDLYKENLSKTTWQNIKGQWNQLTTDPAKFALGTGAGIISQPELLYIPEARIGDVLLDAKAGAAALRGVEAARTAGLASRVAMAAEKMPGIQEAASNAAKAAINTAKDAGDAYGRIVAQRTGLNVAGKVALGAGLNREIAAQQQLQSRGYVQEGSLGAPTAIGGALGLLGSLNELGGKGEPLPSNTPINKEDTVPYTGGVAANGQTIHMDKDFPETINVKDREGKDITLPATDIVAHVHEAEEFKLMHPVGPLGESGLNKIVGRMGKYYNEDLITSKIASKIKEGKPLSYPEAHDIATAVENNHVDSVYNVDPKVYQDALKPYIKDIASRAKEEPATDRPVGIDTKPYDDMGHPEEVSATGQSGGPTGETGGPNESQPASQFVTSRDNNPFAGITSAGKKAILPLGVMGAAGGLGYILAQRNKEKSSILTAIFLGAPYMGTKMDREFASSEGDRLLDVDASTMPDLTERQINFLKAKQLEAQGFSPKQIHAATGYHRGVDSKWLHEVPDINVNGNWGRLSETPTNLSDVLNHPTLFNAEPRLRNVKIRMEKMEGMGGLYDPTTHTITLNDPAYLHKMAQLYDEPTLEPISVLLHETTHVVQDMYGLPRGDSPARHILKYETFKNNLMDQASTIRGMLDSEEARGNEEYRNDLTANLHEILRKIKALNEENIKKLAEWDYNKSAGENLAYLVQARMGMSPEELKENFPPDMMNVPLENQRVEYGHGGDEYNQLPITEQLKDRGEADEDGKLRGFSPKEDQVPNEKEIVAQARAGNNNAVTSLYTNYMPRLIRSLQGAMRVAGPKLGIDAEDVALDSFTKAMQNLHEFKGQSSFYTWLYSIAKNNALNRIAQARRQVPTTSMFRQPTEGGLKFTGEEIVKGSDNVDTIDEHIRNVPGNISSPEEQLIAKQTSDMVDRAISHLPEQMKQPFKMHILDGLEPEEIARQLGIPFGTVLSRIHAARNLIDRSLKRKYGEGYQSQRGSVDIDTLKKLGRLSLFGAAGITGGMYISSEDHKLRGAILGGMIGLTAEGTQWSNFIPNVKSQLAKGDWGAVNDLLNTLDYRRALAERTISQVQAKIGDLVPNAEDRIKISHYLEGDKSVILTPAQLKAAETARDFYNTLGLQSLEGGVLEDFLINYVNHEWQKNPALEKYLQQMYDAKYTNMSTKDRHALARKFTSLAEGKAAGLTPRTEDISQLISIYGRSMFRALANKQLLGGLKERRMSWNTDRRAIMLSGKAPINYVAINHPQLNGYRVDPTIAPSLQFVFDSQNRGTLMGLEGLNIALKREETGLSLFHPLALAQIFLTANPINKIFTAIPELGKSLVGKSSAHRQYIEGGIGDNVDRAMRAGLKFTAPGATSVDQDVGGQFYDALDQIHDFLERIYPGMGKGADAVRSINRLSDRFVWDNVHAGTKLITFQLTTERLNRSWDKKVAADPTVKKPSQQKLDQEAASFVNDTFGGLNWRRMADDCTTRVGRLLALTIANPISRRILQIAMFAPDWTISTMRSWVQAFGKGSGLGGLINPKTLADLHRQYLMRNAILYFTAYNALNFALSGHYIWQNQDPTTVDLGNGEKMQINKHFMEVPHAVQSPSKFALGKMGIVPSEVLDQWLNQEYLSPGVSHPMREGRLAHAARRLQPFSMDAFSRQGTGEMLSNLLGLPIEGNRPPDPEEAKEKRHEAGLKAAETRREKILSGDIGD